MLQSQPLGMAGIPQLFACFLIAGELSEWGVIFHYKGKGRWDDF